MLEACRPVTVQSTASVERLLEQHGELIQGERRPSGHGEVFPHVIGLPHADERRPDAGSAPDKLNGALRVGPITKSVA